MYENLIAKLSSEGEEMKIDIVGMNNKLYFNEFTKEINNNEKRPICQPGTGIYNPRCYDENGKYYGGTFGAIIIDDQYRPGILSNWHVLAVTNEVGPINFYKESSKSHKIDKQFILNWHFRGIDFPITLKQPIEPEEGMKVVKSGYSTDITYGTIEKIGVEDDIKFTIYIDGRKKDEKYHFIDIIKITGEKFADHGDSGAVLLTENNFDPVGLIFAGDHKKNITFACKMSNVFKVMNFKGIICPTKGSLDVDIRTAIEALQTYKGMWHPIPKFK